MMVSSLCGQVWGKWTKPVRLRSMPTISREGTCTAPMPDASTTLTASSTTSSPTPARKRRVEDQAAVWVGFDISSASAVRGSCVDTGILAFLSPSSKSDQMLLLALPSLPTDG